MNFEFVDVASITGEKLRVFEVSETFPKYYLKIVPRNDKGVLQSDEARVYPVNYIDFVSLEEFAKFAVDNWDVVRKLGRRMEHGTCLG